ncbi:MAG: class I SAM-dependent methyltransferase [Candidatus Hydrogenedentes bacterium]|nr:class I SAM-dependent methyltransferase [Candidatus Hydrogenedentota bacterium]
MCEAAVKSWPRHQDFRTVERHYRRLAVNYDRFLYYSSDFVAAVSARVIEALDLRSEDRFVDLGCGTGMFTIEIANRVNLNQPVLAVDPFIEMLAQVPQNRGIRTIMMDALIFSRQTMAYDKVLMKESVHHVRDRVALFENLRRRLSSRGRLLLVGVPPEIDYPLFDAALERSVSWHADPETLAGDMQSAGFAVRTGELTYNHAIPKGTYFEMVRSKYMSLLSTFSDDQIDQGLREMAARYADVSTLRFQDRFRTVLGVKSD